MKIHITKSGVPGECKATVGACPLGDHYDSMAEAVAAIEEENKAEEIPVPVKKEVPIEEKAEAVVVNFEFNMDISNEIVTNAEKYRDRIEAYLRDQDEYQKPHESSLERSRARRKLDHTEKQLIRAAIESMENTDHLPLPVRDAIWDKAWADGHDSGYNQVAYQYEELATIVAYSYEAGRSDVAGKISVYAEQLDTGLYPVTDPDGFIHSKQDKIIARNLRDILGE